MGYHPETLAFSFPPYPKGGTSLGNHPKPWSLGRWFYGLSPWIGFDIWHIDPERSGSGNRRDDSCRWFDRKPGEYATAVKDLLADEGEVQALMNAFARSVHQPAGYSERGWRRMTPADCLAACLMVAMRLEHLRGWRLKSNGKWFVRDRYEKAMRIATALALNETDNLQTSDEPESFVRSVASAMNRAYRPWWRHPKWHVHHWQINVHIWRNLKRATVEKCATCKKPLGFNAVPVNPGDGSHHHSECLGVMSARAPNAAA